MRGKKITRSKTTQKRVGDHDSQGIVARRQGSALLDAERAWFTRRVTDMLHRTRRVLLVFHGAGLEDEERFQELCRSSNLDELCDGLGVAVREVFQSLFDEEEWSELERSSRNIAEGSEALIRTERLKRQKAWLEQGAGVVMDLTHINEEAQKEQDELVTENMRAVESFLGGVGLKDGRASLKKNVVVIPLRQNESSIEGDGEVEVGEQQADEVLYEEPSTLRTTRKRVIADAPKRREVSAEETPQKRRKGVEQEEDEEVQLDPSSEVLGTPDDCEPDTALSDAAALKEFNSKLEAAKEEVRELKVLLSAEGTRMLRFMNVPPPDVSLASAAQGERMVEDGKMFREALSVQDLPNPDNHDNRVIKKLGALLNWWCTVRQGLVFAGVLAHLKKTKRRGGRGIKSRFETTVEKLLDRAVSYEQASRYARVGLLVRSFPQLLYQTQLCCSTGWLATISLRDGTSGALVDLFALLCEDQEYWSQPIEAVGPIEAIEAAAAPNKDGDDQDQCKYCALSDRGLTWRCKGCGLLFHELCAGYPDDGTVCDMILLRSPTRGRSGVPCVTAFEPKLYCAECLVDIESDVPTVLARIEELSAVANFLNANDCPFVLERVPGDGYCIFRILEDFARGKLGMTWSQNVFCKNVAEAAIASIEATRIEINDATFDTEAYVAFRKLARESGRAGLLRSGLWKKLEVQHVLVGYSQIFKGRVRVLTYQNNQGEIKQNGLYFVEDDENEADIQELNVVHWSGLDHYDELVIREK